MDCSSVAAILHDSCTSDVLQNNSGIPTEKIIEVVKSNEYQRSKNEVRTNHEMQGPANGFAYVCRNMFILLARLLQQITSFLNTHLLYRLLALNIWRRNPAPGRGFGEVAGTKQILCAKSCLVYLVSKDRNLCGSCLKSDGIKAQP